MPSLQDKLRQNIVALVRRKEQKEEIIGTGFFIGNDGSIITCSHVVNGGKIPKQELFAKFNQMDYSVEYLRIYPDPEVLDVALLRLTEKKLPPEAVLLPLRKWESVSKNWHRFQTFGFRAPDYFNGLYAAGEVRGHVRVRDSDTQLLQLEPKGPGTQDICPGMSGAPVYDEDTDEIVGIITLLWKQENGGTIPFATPIEEVVKIWPPVKTRLLEEELLQQVLEKVFRGGEWFAEKALKAFYDNLLIPNLVKYDDLDQPKLQSVIEQLRVKAQGRVYDLINCIRNKRPDIPLTKLIEFPPVHRINFVNREDELKEACGRYAVPYLLFEAPAGYGKTELLKTIEQRHFRDGWLCIYVETPQDTSFAVDLANQIALQVGCSDLGSLPNVSAIGYTLAGFIKNRISSLKAPGLILLIDDVERLPESEIDVFLNCFLIALQSGTQELRVRLTGRYIGSLWKQQAKGFELVVKPLTPFRFKYVKDTVCSLIPSQKDLDLCAAHLMQITGGHPGFMAEIIEQMNIKQPIEEHFKDYQDKYYQDIVLPVAYEIRDSISKDIRDIFDVLSIFRRYNYRLLQKIIETKLIEYKDGADSLEKSLTATYLVKRKDGFIHDEIVRRLLAIRLRWEESERFLDVCKKAGHIYEEDLRGTPSERPEFIAVEGLYQELQLQYYQNDQTLQARQTLSDLFFADHGILSQYLQILRSKPNVPDIKANFIALLEDEEKEWEFCFILNFFLRGENQYNDQPYQRMLKQVKNVL